MIASRYGLLQATRIEKKRNCRQMARGNSTKLVAAGTENGRDQLRLMVFLTVTLRQSQTAHDFDCDLYLDCKLVWACLRMLQVKAYF
jgi:hypothetical protein